MPNYRLTATVHLDVTATDPSEARRLAFQRVTEHTPTKPRRTRTKKGQPQAAAAPEVQSSATVTGVTVQMVPENQITADYLQSIAPIAPIAPITGKHPMIPTPPNIWMGAESSLPTVTVDPSSTHPSPDPFEVISPE